MKFFTNVLVVYNSQADNQFFLDNVVDFVKRNHATLTVIDVIEKAPVLPSNPRPKNLKVDSPMRDLTIIETFSDGNSEPPPSVPVMNDFKEFDITRAEPAINIQEHLLLEEQQNFQNFIKTIQRSEISVNSKTIYGIPFIEIIREVMRNKHDLVIISAEGEGGLKGSLFGTTTLHLMRKCPCPVWVIKPGQSRQISRILAAVDLDQDDMDRTELAKNIIELAVTLAQSGHNELLILHAWSLFGESTLRGRGGISDLEISRLQKETQDIHRQWLIELLHQFSMENLNLHVYLLKGDAGNLISELAHTKAVDLIVMGTVSRGGIAGFLIGNTAEKILQKVDCSILTVKPEGFISPVKLVSE